MNKTKVLFICALIFALACIALTGCSKTEQISSINLKDIDPEASIEMPMGKFDFSQYTVAVNYDSGRVEEIVLIEDMISEIDRLKFYQPGEHTITVSYGKKSCEFKISVKRETFGELAFPENNVFVYDGQEHRVELGGEIPANATVSYIGGNSFVNAGTYDVTAVVTCNGYVTERISTTVTIERAKYDIGNVTLESKEVVYDGAEHSIAISGELPEGISVPIYYINGNNISGAIDAGEYKVTAVFPNNNPNYDSIPNLEATLTILPAEYDIGEIDVIFKDEKGTPCLGAWKVYDGESVIFDIENAKALENYMMISYTVSDWYGNVISRSNTDTNIKDAGFYTVKIDFVLLDNKNYKEIEPVETFFFVDCAEYDASEFTFDSEIVEYDGEEHFLTLILPESLKNSQVDISYEYYRAGEDVAIEINGEKATSVCDAGEYTVNAIITPKDSNYKQMDPIKATLVIDKKVLPASEMGFDSANLTYTGNAMMPSLRFEIENYLTLSQFTFFKLEGGEYVEVENAKDVGTYRAEVTVSLSDTKNYVFDNEKTDIKIVGDFSIGEAKIDVSDIGFSLNNASVVNRGESLTLDFDSKNIDGLKFDVMFYKIDGDELLCVIESKSVSPDETGMISILFDSSSLENGTYICAVTARAESSNFVISGGDEVIAYYFEFKVNEIIIDIDALFKDNVSYEYNGRDLQLESFNNLDEEIRQYLSCDVWRIDEYSGSNWDETSYAGSIGYYRVQYCISVNSNFSHVKLLVNGAKVNSVIVYHRFYIV